MNYTWAAKPAKWLRTEAVYFIGVEGETRTTPVTINLDYVKYYKAEENYTRLFFGNNSNFLIALKTDELDKLLG